MILLSRNQTAYIEIQILLMRENGKMIVLDSGNLDSDEVIDFKATLIEPVIIDRIADVFIEFITIQNLRLSNTTAHLETVSLFTLNIDELPTQIGTTNADFIDKYIFLMKHLEQVISVEKVQVQMQLLILLN